MTHRKEASEKIAKYLLHLTNREALFNKMGSLEKLCFRWNDFGGNVSRSFASIRESNQFFDCTLTTEDDDDDAYSEYLRAHKIILSASSDFFRKVLTREYMCTNPNPVMYLRGISAKDLKHILDFIYHGEVNVAKDDLDKFLEVAETLKIHGLTSSVRACKRPAKSPSSSYNDSIKKPKVMAWTPSQCTTKREPEDSAMTESCPSLDDFENIVEENNDNALGDEDNNEQSIANYQVIKDGDDRDRGSEDFEPREINDCAISEEDYMGGQSGANKDVNNGDDANLSSGSTGEGGSGMGNEPASSYRVQALDYNRKPSGPIVGGDSVKGKISKGPKWKHLTGTEKDTLINIIKTLDIEHILRDASDSRDPETKEEREALWRQIEPAFNEICGTNYDMGKLKRTVNRIKAAPNSNPYSLLYDDANESSGSTGKGDSAEGNEAGDNEDQASGSTVGGDSGEGKDPEGYKSKRLHHPTGYKHLTTTEKVNLINIIKTLDKEHILRGIYRKDGETKEERKALWRKIVPAFNDICGTNYDMGKLKRTVNRIKAAPNSKPYSLLYDDTV